MVFPAGYCDSNTRNVARLEKSVEKHKPVLGECFFFSFLKVEQHPKCLDHSILHGKSFGICFIK